MMLKNHKKVKPVENGRYFSFTFSYIVNPVVKLKSSLSKISLTQMLNYFYLLNLFQIYFC